MIVHTFKRNKRKELILIQSDHHHGASGTQTDLIANELDQACGRDVIYLNNGDLGDCINVKDKRFQVNAVNEPLQKKKAIINGVTNDIVKFFLPFKAALQNAVFCLGNHDETWINWCGFDLIDMVIQSLNDKGCRIQHGGIAGFVNVFVKGGDRPLKHTIYRHHGAGGDSPVTKGTIDFNRLRNGFDFDSVTFGHKHNKLAMELGVWSTNNLGRAIKRPIWCIQTASYFENYGSNPTDPADYTYAESKCHSPKPTGGWWLAVEAKQNAAGHWGIKPSVMSDLVDLPEKR